MSFGIYMTGFFILMIGLALGAHMMHVPQQWIGVGAVVMLGLGILLVSRTPKGAIRINTGKIRLRRDCHRQAIPCMLGR
jgi:hypothetical protein